MRRFSLPSAAQPARADPRPHRDVQPIPRFTADAMGNPELVTIQSAAPPGGRGRQSSIARWSFTSDEPVLQKHLLSNVANSLTVRFVAHMRARACLFKRPRSRAARFDAVRTR